MIINKRYETQFIDYGSTKTSTLKGFIQGWIATMGAPFISTNCHYPPHFILGN